MVVVLPEPLTPATRMMKGRAVISSGLATGASTFSISRASSALSSSGVISWIEAAFGEAGGDTGGKFRPEIGADQFVFELLHRRGVELALGEILRRAAEQR